MSNDYESDLLLSEYLLLHYGTANDAMPHPFGPKDALDFPRRCVDELVPQHALPQGATALDLGCAVGRSTFELARHCDSVIGIDLSQRFIETASGLAQNGSIDFWYIEEGKLQTPCTFEIPAHCPRDRVSFQVGDAVALPDDLGQFDIVLMANLICRTPKPAECLRQGMARVKPGGLLILTTPYTWVETFTAPAEWLGGQGGDAARGWDGVSAILNPEFKLNARHDMPFCIREHSRKFQWSVADASVWKRR